MKRFLITLSMASMALTACSGADSDDAVTETVTTETVAAEAAITVPASASVTYSDAYMLLPLKGRDVGAAFFVASNSGTEDARLVSASTPVAETVELHTHTMADGVMSMREVDGIDVPAGGSVTLEPGSFHLMMFGMAVEDGTTEAPVTLTYSDGETVTLNIPVRSRG